MSDIMFSMGQIRHCPEIHRTVQEYRNDLARRKMPSTWPDSDLIHQASLFYNGDPITMIMFAPLKRKEFGDEVGENVYIAGAYTVPSWRRLGLYSDLVGIVVNEWRKEDAYEWMRGGFHLGNDMSRAMQLKQGREFYEIKGEYQRTRMSLRPTGDEYELTQETLRPILDKLDKYAVDPMSRYAN